MRLKQYSTTRFIVPDTDDAAYCNINQRHLKASVGKQDNPIPDGYVQQRDEQIIKDHRGVNKKKRHWNQAAATLSKKINGQCHIDNSEWPTHTSRRKSPVTHEGDAPPDCEGPGDTAQFDGHRNVGQV